ncbi:hypothetical protein Gpo141_00012327 [Globisporangium polare]
MASPKESIEALVASNPVVVYAKSYCPHCAKTKALLTELGVHFVLVDLDLIPEGEALQNALADLTGQRTVPNVFIGAKSVGGNSDVQELHAKEQLVSLLKANGALA